MGCDLCQLDEVGEGLMNGFSFSNLKLGPSLQNRFRKTRIILLHQDMFQLLELNFLVWPFSITKRNSDVMCVCGGGVQGALPTRLLFQPQNLESPLSSEILCFCVSRLNEPVVGRGEGEL